MKGFIELTERNDGFKVLLSLDKVMSIVETEESAFIETGVDKKGESTGFFTKESYAEIVQQLRGNP